MPFPPSGAQRPRPLLLFDLDGTLLLTNGAGARAMERAGKRVWGERFTTALINFGGSLDPVVVREATEGASLEFTPERHLEFRREYQSELRLELAHPATQSEALPGVLSLLAALREVNRASLGLLTGNYEETGVQKLQAVGIEPSWFSPRVWGDDAPTRPGLVQVAIERQAHSSADTVVVIGDTTRDVHCAKVNGCRAVGVATGGCSETELREAGADLTLPDLSDPARLWSLLAELNA